MAGFIRFGKNRYVQVYLRPIFLAKIKVPISPTTYLLHCQKLSLVRETGENEPNVISEIKQPAFAPALFYCGLLAVPLGLQTASSHPAKEEQSQELKEKGSEWNGKTV